MSKFVSWYLVELDGLLRGQISADRLHALLAEVEAHLIEAIQERVSRGMPQEEAELATLEAMGSPEKVAHEELRVAGVTKGADRAFKMSSFALFGLGAGWLFAGTLPEAQFHPLVGLFWLAAVSVLLVSSFIAQNIPWRALAVATVCGIVSLSMHQGTRHVYLGDEEILIQDARAFITSANAGVGDATTEAWRQADATARASALQAELNKSSLQRMAERAVPAAIVVPIFMGLNAGVLLVVTKLRKRTLRHWLRTRLA
jgi:hypothetical protein